MGSSKPTKILRRLARIIISKCRSSSSSPSSDLTPFPALTPSSCTSASTFPPQPCPSLPIEVIELIIDFAWQDRTTLLACVLTCRAWYPRAHANLFARITLSSVAQLTHYAALLAADTRLATTLKELWIMPYYGQSQLLGNVPFALAESLAGARALGKVRSLGVEKLRIDIRRDYYPYVHPDWRPTFAAHFRGVRALELRRVQFPALADLATLVGALSALEDLACVRVDWVRKTYDHKALEDCAMRPRLRRLAVREVAWGSGWADWLECGVDVGVLEELRVAGLAEEDVHAVEGVLQRASASLHVLEVGMARAREARPWIKAGVESEGGTGSYPSLIHNTALTSLTFILRDEGDWLVGPLVQVNSPYLTEVIIRLPVRTKPKKMKHHRLDAVDDVLSCVQFANLLKLTVEYDAGWDPSPARVHAYRTEIPARFPLACARQILSVRPVKREVEYCEHAVTPRQPPARDVLDEY